MFALIFWCSENICTSGGKVTEKIFYSDKKSTNLKVELIKITTYKNDCALIFNKTIFYPEGGGQPADKGYVSGKEVIQVIEIEGEILHLIKSEDRDYFYANIGLEMEMEIDWNRRVDHSVQHSAQHLLSAVLFDDLGYQTLSFHLGDSYSTIEIDTPTLSPDQTDYLEKKVFRAICENRPLNVITADNLTQLGDLKLRKQPVVETEIRIVEIEGYDASPCGGTHVDSTCQIGIIKITKTDKIRNNTRIYYLAGMRAFSDYNYKCNIISNLSKHLTCHENDIYATVIDKYRQVKELTSLNKKLTEDIALKIVTEKGNNEIFSYMVESLNSSGLSSALSLLTESRDNIKFTIIGEIATRTISLNSKINKFDCGKIVKDFVVSGKGKGGGNSQRAQLVINSEADLKIAYHNLVSLLTS